MMPPEEFVQETINAIDWTPTIGPIRGDNELERQIHADQLRKEFLVRTIVSMWEEHKAKQGRELREIAVIPGEGIYIVNECVDPHCNPGTCILCKSTVVGGHFVLNELVEGTVQNPLGYEVHWSCLRNREGARFEKVHI